MSSSKSTARQNFSGAETLIKMKVDRDRFIDD